MKPSVKVLFLNTRKRLIDCGVLLCLGRQPDVIILAELTQGSQKEYEKSLKVLGFKHMSRPTLHSRKRHVRLYSKLPLKSNRRFSRNGNKLKNNWLYCRINGVLISVIHMPTKGMKERPFDQLWEWMKKQADNRTLLIGDFNTDLSDKKWGRQLKTWTEFGWRNLWDGTPGGDKAWTFKGTRKSDQRRRIDHAFAGQGLRNAKLTHLPSFRLRRLSDHSGLLVEFG
jgi:exonuclease III